LEGFVKFVGTGGARFVVATQIRSTAGLLLGYRDTHLYIDPGPGALVRIHDLAEPFDLSRLDGILLTHKHLDHSNDVNVLIEAMTEGGFTKKGVLFCPEDALGEDPVVHRYVTKYLERLEYLKEGGRYEVKEIAFSVPVRHMHRVKTFGAVFHLNKIVALISDTRYFEELPDFYRADVLIVNVLRMEPVAEQDPLDHLSLEDFIRIVKRVKPEVAIMTHFGLSMVRARPDLVAERLTKETGIHIVAAHDGMRWDF
jgi:ribonuclease BN (tRNA processing enzyme)